MSDKNPAEEPLDEVQAEEVPEASPNDVPREGLADGQSLKDIVEAPDSGPAEAYLRRARLAEDRLQEVLAAYRKLKADNEGHRERSTRNIERRFDQRRERLLLKFIDILDNLDRALEAAERSYAGEPLIEGLILVRTQLLQTLQEEGLERIPVIGLPYDPNFSEAVETTLVEDPDHDQLVVKELMRGYRLNGRVARASRVAVGRYDAPAEAPVAAPVEPAAAPETPAEPSIEDIVAQLGASPVAALPSFAEPEADEEELEEVEEVEEEED